MTIRGAASNRESEVGARRWAIALTVAGAVHLGALLVPAPQRSDPSMPHPPAFTMITVEPAASLEVREPARVTAQPEAVSAPAARAEQAVTGRQDAPERRSLEQKRASVGARPASAAPVTPAGHYEEVEVDDGDDEVGDIQPATSPGGLAASGPLLTSPQLLKSPPGRRGTAEATGGVADSGGQSVDAAARYAERVRRLIDAHKRYPRRERRRGLEGEVTLRLRVSARGALLGSPKIVRSSGVAGLDREALRMARAAAPYPDNQAGRPLDIQVLHPPTGTPSPRAVVIPSFSP